MSQTLFDYTRQDAAGTCSTAHAWAKAPAPLTPPQRKPKLSIRARGRGS